MIDNMKIALRENLWQGRAGGFDVTMTSSSALNSSDIIPMVIKQNGSSSSSRINSSSSSNGEKISKKKVSKHLGQSSIPIVTDDERKINEVTSSSEFLSSVRFPPLQDE